MLEALRFAVAVFEAQDAGEDDPMETVWKDYSVEEQFAIANAFGGTREGLTYISSFIMLKMLATPEMHSMSMSDQKACEILLAKRARVREHARN